MLKEWNEILYRKEELSMEGRTFCNYCHNAKLVLSYNFLIKGRFLSKRKQQMLSKLCCTDNKLYSFTPIYKPNL